MGMFSGQCSREAGDWVCYGSINSSSRGIVLVVSPVCKHGYAEKKTGEAPSFHFVRSPDIMGYEEFTCILKQKAHYTPEKGAFCFNAPGLEQSSLKRASDDCSTSPTQVAASAQCHTFPRHAPGERRTVCDQLTC